LARREPVFTGTCTALVTPFDTYGGVNYSRFTDLIEEQICAGVDALCICGTTGETPTLSIREHLNAIEFCCRCADHRIKIIAGTGANSTEEAAYLSQRAQELGADALLVVTPYYNKTTQTGLVRHYEYITDRVDLPVILYNVPSRTGLSFKAETYQRLAQNPGINGVKEASGNFDLISHTLQLCPDDFSVWSGNDDQVVPMMALGARGVISVASNVVPGEMVRLTRLCLSGDFQEASALQLKLLGLIDALFCEVNPIPVKSAMNLMGKEVGGLRLPLCEASSEHLSFIKQKLNELHLLS